MSIVTTTPPAKLRRGGMNKGFDPADALIGTKAQHMTLLRALGVCVK